MPHVRETIPFALHIDCTLTIRRTAGVQMMSPLFYYNKRCIKMSSERETSAEDTVTILPALTKRAEGKEKLFRFDTLKTNSIFW
jgi:hypothetical protein